MMHAKLAKQHRYVDFYRADAQAKLSSDFLVGSSGYDQIKDFTLTRGQRLIFAVRE